MKTKLRYRVSQKPVPPPEEQEAIRERRNADQRRRRQERAGKPVEAKPAEPVSDPNADLDRIADRIYDRIARKDMFDGLTAALDEELVEDTVDDAQDAIRMLFDYIEAHGPPGVLDALLNGLDLKRTAQDDQIAAIQAAIDGGGSGWTGVGNARERREEVEKRRAEELSALRDKYGLGGTGPSAGTVRAGPINAIYGDAPSTKPATLTDRAGTIIDRMTAAANMLSVVERTLTDPNAPTNTAAGALPPQPGSLAGSLDLIHTISFEIEDRLRSILDRLG